MPGFRNRLALKIVLPFALLTLAIGAAGTLAATSELSARAQSAFDGQLLHEGLAAQSTLQAADARRHALLRLLATTPRLGSAWSDPPALQTVLERALAVHPNTVVEAVDRFGREMVGVAGHGEAGTSLSQNQDLSAWPGLTFMLNGGADRLEAVTPVPRPMVVSGQLVRDANKALLGALLVADVLADVGVAIREATHDDAIFYDAHGHVLTTTLGIAPDQWSTLALDSGTRNQVSPSSVVQLERQVGGPRTELVAPWTAKDVTLGYVGVLASSAGLVADTTRLRLIMAGLFLAGVLLTLVIGIWLARRITRPVHTLVEATRLVSAGDLAHRTPVTTRDEIGELTESFNAMTSSLHDKSVSLRDTMTRLQDTYLMTIEALAAAVEARDPYTHGHTRRVQDYALIMASALGVGEEDTQALRRACVLHDIGKIGIEDQILRKQARLEPNEELRMQRHPVIGVEMLRGIDFLDLVLPLIRHHHERWDGTGYPDQMRADEIPLGARILAVADALDAMTSDRPYRPARTFDYAKGEILKGSGTHFDPEVVTAFIKSQRAMEELLEQTASNEVHQHPEPGDLGGWRLHVVGR